jgi:hypothetical protein
LGREELEASGGWVGGKVDWGRGWSDFEIAVEGGEDVVELGPGIKAGEKLIMSRLGVAFIKI